MTLNLRTIHTALIAALGLAACGDSKGDDSGGSTTALTTTGPDGTDTGTSPTGPTTGIVDPDTTTGGTTGPGPTTGPEPTTGEPIDPAIYEQCKANNADAAALAELQCMCLVAAGDSPDQATCLAEYGTPADQADCTCMVYAKTPDTKPILDCIGPPQKTFLECFTMAGCDDTTAQEACLDAYFPVVLACPEPSKEFNNANALECLGAELFMCGSGEQLPDYVVCDFQNDCADGSDEARDCPPAFMCMDGTKIPAEYKCDGFPDCRDMSDEVGCPTFMCTNGEEILESLKCNGVPDCMDMSDEVDCPVFMCASGEELPPEFECDGFPDCRDGSDEADCP